VGVVRLREWATDKASVAKGRKSGCGKVAGVSDRQSRCSKGAKEWVW